jgi:hypothetical protein
MPKIKNKSKNTSEKNSGADKLKSSALFSLLSRVNLKGVIDECVLKIKDNVATIEAIDMSNTIYVHAEESVEGLKDVSIGLCKLSLLTQFLENTEDEIIFKIDKQWLTLKKPGSSQIKVLLLEEGQVPTAIDQKGESPVKKLLKKEKSSFILTQEAANEILKCSNLVNADTTIFEIERGKVFVGNQKTQEQQFNVPCGGLQKDMGSNIRVEVYSKYLLSVIQAVDFTKEITVSMSNDFPIIVQQDKNNTWAITPILSEE